ncbi:hypothetical protein GY45DRAFT_1324441 [Cubamyces sp. BRFM 1775]|nr:hypothetical protein GY45DRAFT_1324441 [Cubamyces sp. BRFM 1775]
MIHPYRRGHCRGPSVTLSVASNAPPLDSYSHGFARHHRKLQRLEGERESCRALVCDARLGRDFSVYSSMSYHSERGRDV